MRGVSLRACLLVLVACDTPPAAAPQPDVAPAVPTPVAPTVVAPPDVAAPSTAPADVAPPVAPADVAAPPAEPSVETLLEGSGPSGAEGRAARRQAVLDLLTDGRSAAALDMIAASPGRSFDPELAEAMTPKVIVNKSTPPQVLQLKAKVEGSLDADIVRRIVRAHINEVRYCYSQGLARNPTLAGKLEIEFVILADGKVATAIVRPSTLADPQVGNCTANAIRRWIFPKPESGVVKVLYPFSLSPS